LDGRVNSITEGPNKGKPFGIDEDGTVLDPRIMARVARLLRWYPRTWRERYGAEFEAVLTSSLVDGKGGLSLSMNVAREGLAARLESAGFVGRTAPAIERARASVMTVFVATLGFLTSAIALLIYSKGWQASPRIEALRRAVLILSRSKAAHAFSKAMSSPLHRRIQLAAVRSGNGNSPAWRALYKFQDKARSSLENSAAGHAFTRVMSAAHPASGSPIIFNHIAYYVTGVAIICVAVAFIFLVFTTVSAQWRVDSKPLRAPLGFVFASTVFAVLAAVAYHAFEQSPPGEPAAWKSLRLLLEGNFNFWPAIVFPLCAVISMVLAMVGGPKLLRRVDYSTRLYRVESSLAVALAVCLGIVVISTVTWVATLTAQAPDFLTVKDGGPFGMSFLPIFLVAVVVMLGTSWYVLSRSARCVRITRPA
jgi:hypothetical protein